MTADWFVVAQNIYLLLWPIFRAVIWGLPE